jgi:HPt (histidine-containing phosphotransfer) domain-containing protein
MKKPTADEIDNLLVTLWQKNLPTLRERLDLLDRIGKASAAGTLPEDSRQEALSVAHKLSGSLGMFGYAKGTEIAAQMERILKAPTPDTLSTLKALAANLRKSLAKGL